MDRGRHDAQCRRYREERLERKRNAGAEAGDQDRPYRQRLAIAAQRIGGERRQKGEHCDMFALGEDIHRQDRYDGCGPDDKRSPFHLSQRRRQPQDARHGQQRGSRKQQKLGVDHVARIDAQHARQRDTGQIGKGCHRRVDLDDVTIKLLPVQHAFAQHEQPAYVRIQRNHLPQQDSHEKNHAGQKQRHRRQPFPPCRT